MARKRMIDPNIWQSEDFGKLSDLAKLVFIGLFSLADDEGRGRCSPVYLKSSIFPYKEDLRSADIEKTLCEISSCMSVIFYSCDGNNFYSLYNWDTWQTINRPTPSKIPQYDKNNKAFHVLFNEGSMSTHGVLTPKKNRKEKEKKENRIEKEEEEKMHFAEFVSMTNTEYEKLVSTYGKEFTDQCIKKLDNYKGASR